MVPLQVLGVMLLLGPLTWMNKPLPSLILAFSFSKQATRRHGPRVLMIKQKLKAFWTLLLDQFSERDSS